MQFGADRLRVVKTRLRLVGQVGQMVRE